MRSLADGFKKFARGMILGVADNGDRDAKAGGNGAFGYCFRGVVGALGVDVRAESFQQRFNRRLTEENHVIDSPKRSDEDCPSILIQNGTAGAFQGANRRIRVNADDQHIAFATRAFEIADVTNVKSIETAVGENDSLAALLVLRNFAS